TAELLSVDGLLQRLACPEFCPLAGRQLDWLASLGVARFRRFAPRHRECAEADETYIVAAPQRSHDVVERCLDGFARLALGELGVLGDLGDQFILVHDPNSSLRSWGNAEQALGHVSEWSRKTPFLQGFSGPPQNRDSIQALIRRPDENRSVKT